jgi:hypothetical protein
MSLRLELAIHHFLNAGVILHDLDIAPPLHPVFADSLCLDKSGTTWRPHGGSFLRSLEYLQVQAGSGVRGDVAVHEPTAGVVGLEGDDDVCAAVGHDDISSGRVIAVKFLVNGTCTLDIVLVEVLVGLVDDGKVVAVEMNLGIGERLRALGWLTAGMNDLRDGRRRRR